jgi:HAD superfamily hydrolase (TIGR01509 family)
MLAATLFPHDIAAVILDMDGTLIDTERLYKACTLEALAALGWPDQQALLLKMVGLSSDKCDALLCTTFGRDFPLEAYHRAFIMQRKARLRDTISLKTGALALLDALAAARMPMAIATSSSRESAERHLRLSGLRERFDTVITADDVVAAKPSPDIYLLAAHMLGVNSVACVAIEDSGYGAMAAQAAGMSTIMVPDMVQPDARIRARCVAVCTDLHESLTLLQTHIPSLLVL